MFTIAEVVRIMGEDNGILVEEQEVKQILQKYIVEIEKGSLGDSRKLKKI
jgi:hypothetical protein